MRIVTTVLLLLLLGGCATVEPVVQRVIESRARMNDDQARFTLRAICDISIGSYWRVLDDPQRRLVDEVCSRGYSPR